MDPVRFFPTPSAPHAPWRCPRQIRRTHVRPRRITLPSCSQRAHVSEMARANSASSSSDRGRRMRRFMPGDVARICSWMRRARATRLGFSSSSRDCLRTGHRLAHTCIALLSSYSMGMRCATQTCLLVSPHPHCRACKIAWFAAWFLRTSRSAWLEMRSSGEAGNSPQMSTPRIRRLRRNHTSR